MPVSRPRRIPLLRLALLAIAVAAFATAGAQLARGAEGEPAPAASVTIVPSGGGAPRTVALADLAAQQDVHGNAYRLRAADGATSTVTVAAGLSLQTLLRAAGLDGDPFTYVEIVRPDGSAAFVLRDQLAGGDEGPPVVWGDEQGAHFLRPSLGDDDPNAPDHVVQPGGALRVELHTGDPLAARISASALRARPNEPIDFSATLVAGALQPGMSFRWYFDHGSYVMGASVTHRFPRAGRYTVLLDVVRGGEAVGVPGVVVVRIAKPEEERRDGARRSGESRGDGGRDGGGSGGAGGGTGSGTGAGSGSGAGGLPDPGPVAPTPPSVAPAAPPPPEPTPQPARPKPRRAATPPGKLVSGTLLASAGGVPLPAGGDAQPAAASDAAHDPLQIPIGVWVGIGLAALLALGWTLESRHTIPFWQP